MLLFFLVLTVPLVALNLMFVQGPEAKATSNRDLVVVAFVGVVLNTLFWFRAFSPLADAWAIERLEEGLVTDGGELIHRHEGSVLHLTVVWPDAGDRSNYRQLSRIRATANLASRLVERNDTNRLVLEMTRGGRTFASLEWPHEDAGRAGERGL